MKTPHIRGESRMPVEQDTFALEGPDDERIATTFLLNALFNLRAFFAQQRRDERCEFAIYRYRA